MYKPDKIVLTVFVLLLAIAGCKSPKHEVEFAFCRNASQMGCIPPLIKKQALVMVRHPQIRATMADFYNQIYFDGETLAFEYRPKDLLKTYSTSELSNQLKFYYELESGSRFIMEKVDFNEKVITGLSLIGSILEKKYITEKNEPFRLPPPFKVTYLAQLNNKIIFKASTEIILSLTP